MSRHDASYVINNLDQTIRSFQSRVDVRVDEVDVSTANIQATTDKIYNNIERFKVDMLHGEESQIAHENILRIDQILKEQFSNYTAIRRTVMGVVRDFDINLVRNSTIQELSEELWITSSRYWLSYALIAITAWVNNYPEVAKNALSESGRRDAIKTTLFFCLMNLRFGRNETAKKWFYEYLKVLDPTMLQQETAVLLQAFLNGLFGRDKELEHNVIELIDEWIGVINDDAQICSELVGSYESYINNLRSPVGFNYQAILAYCVNADEVERSFRDVSKFAMLQEFVDSLDVEGEFQSDENYKSRVDAVLMNLISNYDDDELELKKQQEYYRCVVEAGGEIELAEARYQAMEELRGENFNIGKQMINWVLYATGEDVQVRKFGLQNTKEWFKNAIENFDIALRTNKPNEFKLAIDKWTGISNGNDLAEQETSMRNFFDNNKFQNVFVNMPNILAVIILIVSAGLAFTSLYSLIATGLALAFLVFNIVRSLNAYPIRVNTAINNLRVCMEEIADYRRCYEEEHLKKDDLMGTIEFI